MLKIGEGGWRRAHRRENIPPSSSHWRTRTCYTATATRACLRTACRAPLLMKTLMFSFSLLTQR